MLEVVDVFHSLYPLHYVVSSMGFGGRYRAILVLHGNPQCGKSRFYEFVRSMFGAENCMELGNGDRTDFYWANLISNLRAPHGNAFVRTFLGNGE